MIVEDVNTGKLYNLEEIPRNKVAFVVGHYEDGQGAYSDELREFEYIFWTDFAMDHLLSIGEVFVHDPTETSYTQRQIEMAKRTKDFELVFELHFNSFNGSAKGCEALFFKGNSKMETLAMEFGTDMSTSMGYSYRGAKSITSGDRGYQFLKRTKGDAMILEPFFGDNKDDVKLFKPLIYKRVIETLIGKYYST